MTEEKLAKILEKMEDALGIVDSMWRTENDETKERYLEVVRDDLMGCYEMLKEEDRKNGTV